MPILKLPIHRRYELNPVFCSDATNTPISVSNFSQMVIAMFKKFALTLGLAVGLCAINTSKASALDFTFSFSNNGGNVNGTVTGTVYGLTDNVTSSATRVTIESYPTGLGTPVDGLIATDWGGVQENSFTVANGAITAGDFLSYGPNSGLCLNSNDNCFTGSNSNALTFNQDRNTVVNFNDFQGVAFTPATAAVPWEFNPTEGVALGLPLFIGLRVLKKRRALKKSQSEVHEMIRSR